MRWWMRRAVFTIASWRMTQPITAATICSAAKPQRRAVALRFLRPGRPATSAGDSAWTLEEARAFVIHINEERRRGPDIGPPGHAESLAKPPGFSELRPSWRVLNIEPNQET
jgi:hypothetical protein